MSYFIIFKIHSLQITNLYKFTNTLFQEYLKYPGNKKLKDFFSELLIFVNL